MLAGATGTRSPFERAAAEVAEKARIEEADRQVRLLAEQKAERDRRYAARKERKK